MRIWEIARKPKLVIRDLPIPLTIVRSRARVLEEEVIPVLEPDRDKVVGFLTPIELMLPTSHHTTIRVRDALREHPILTQDNDLLETFNELRRFKVVGAPVVDNLDQMRLIGVISYSDILSYLLKTGYKPLAETVSEIMTIKDLNKYIITWNDRVNKAWSRIVFRGQPGLVVVRSYEEPIPMGIITYREFVRKGRWLFHRESEQHIITPAKVQRIMLRGVLVATHNMPIEIVAKVMAEHDLPLIPVIDDNGRVIGVITYEDMIRAYLEGAKPGRVPVPITPRLPIPVVREERPVFISREKVLAQVYVSKPIEKPVYLGVTANDIMLTAMPAITINDTVEHARREMLRKKTDYLLVINEKDEIVGVVTKWNMLHALALKGPLWRRRSKDKYFIDYILQQNIPRVKTDTPIENIALYMVSSESEVVFVTNDEGEIVGFVTKDQVIDAARKLLTDLYVENVITPGKTASVNPFHSLYHAVNKMKTLYLDALTVYNGKDVVGVLSSNRLPFIALEDAITGVKSRRLIWVRKLVKGAARKGRYVKITPLLVIDAMVPYKKYIEPSVLLSKAIDVMKNANLNGIPVLSSDREIISIVSKNDILRELSRRAKKIAKVMVKVKEKY
ncbi:MAG: CBS domain-containing protein [Desulfurococcales archaeon]|nr:CBS domain-containing protein [Desulfurococcales archaeon]